MLVLGCKIGPSSDVVSLLHEMSHLAEIEDERVCLNNWGLRQGTLLTLERDEESGYELTTTMFIKRHHLDREIRVLAYQTAHQTRLFGESVSPTDVLASLIYLPDVRWSFESEPEFWAYCQCQFEQALTQYTFERFEEEWWHKMRVLHHTQSGER